MPGIVTFVLFLVIAYSVNRTLLWWLEKGVSEERKNHWSYGLGLSTTWSFSLVISMVVAGLSVGLLNKIVAMLL